MHKHITFCTCSGGHVYSTACYMTTGLQKLKPFSHTLSLAHSKNKNKTLFSPSLPTFSLSPSGCVCERKKENAPTPTPTPTPAFAKLKSEAHISFAFSYLFLSPNKNNHTHDGNAPKTLSPPCYSQTLIITIQESKSKFQDHE